MNKAGWSPVRLISSAGVGRAAEVPRPYTVL
jgi:hypothetical protein